MKYLDLLLKVLQIQNQNFRLTGLQLNISFINFLNFLLNPTQCCEYHTN
jgi:hypothetical protein